MKKPRELYALANALKAHTTNNAVLTVCEELMARLVGEMADKAEPTAVVALAPLGPKLKAAIRTEVSKKRKA